MYIGKFDSSFEECGAYCSDEVFPVHVSSQLTVL